jgi:hypothetical protein
VNYWRTHSVTTPAQVAESAPVASSEHDAAVESTLAALRNCKVSTLLLYTPHHSSDFAYRVGTIVGRQKFTEAELLTCVREFTAASTPCLIA